MWTKKTIKGSTCYTADGTRDLTETTNITPILEAANKSSGIYNIEYASSLGYIYSTKTSKGDELPNGVYRYIESIRETYLMETTIRTDLEILDLDVSNKVLEDFNNFKKAELIYKNLKMFWKRGVMLYGPPGTGKTSIIHKIIKQLMINDTDIIIIFSGSSFDPHIIENLQADKRLKIIIYEEFTNFTDHGEVQQDILDFLDGERSLDNCFIIASTNYPEQLPKNITARPGRFDKFYNLGTLKTDDIIKYLKHFDIIVELSIIEQLIGRTMAELKEIILLHKRDNLSILEANTVMQKHKDTASSDFEERNRIGYIL